MANWISLVGSMVTLRVVSTGSWETKLLQDKNIYCYFPSHLLYAVAVVKLGLGQILIQQFHVLVALTHWC